MGILYILLGAAFGAIITYLRLDSSPLTKNEEFIKLKNTDRSLDKRIKSGESLHQRIEQELELQKVTADQRAHELQQLNEELVMIKNQLNGSINESPVVESAPQPEKVIIDRSGEVEKLEQQIKILSGEKSDLESDITSLEEANLQVAETIARLEKALEEKTVQNDELDRLLTQEKEAHQASKQQLEEQRTSFEALGKKFNSDFQNMASKILDELESPQKKK